MKTMYLLRGVSGSGKSTFAKKLASLTGGFHCENDTYHTDANGVYKYDIANKDAAQDWCYSQIVDKMRLGEKDVIVANTNTDNLSIHKYLEAARIFGYTVISLVVENRHGNSSIHDVPERIRDTQASEIIQSLKLK